MQVLNPNNVKIYNLSSGKSLPDWLSERKRRMLQNKDVDVRRRIELIQDFEMPGVSTGVKVSKNGQYILASGVYKPRIRCYDVNNLSMKFERCFDSEAVKFELLSDDYSKIVLLQCDRSVEFHAQYGSYYRTRIPKFGRDMAYHQSSCDLYLVGASSEIYRLNLEQGKFLNSLQSNASSINRISINPVHELVVCGTIEGKVEAWDPRDRQRIGILDCAMNCLTDETDVRGFPSVSALSFKDALTMAVGTTTGQILLYDIRAQKPFIVKDHMYGLPIKKIDFIKNEDLVASIDSKCVKFWKQNTGKPYTAIQAPADLNDMCIVPDTGLMFLANEEKKILIYYIPSIGPAPKWCYFLDNITEELEESQTNTVYDDYKFVTAKELEDLGLLHLAGTGLLRAYMHGFFMDVRLYNKAKAIVQPFAYKEFQKKKIREKLDDERKNRVIVKNLPKVNKLLAQKLLERQMEKPDQKAPQLMQDERFKALFDDPEFTIDESVEEFNHIKPLLNKLEKSIQKSKKKNEAEAAVPYEQFEAVQEEDDEKRHDYTSSSDAESEDDDTDSSSEEDVEELKSSELVSKQKLKKMQVKQSESTSQPKLYEIKETENFKMLKKRGESSYDSLNVPLGERLAKAQESFEQLDSSAGNKIVTFTLKKPNAQKKREEENKAHAKERAMYRRPANNLRK